MGATTTLITVQEFFAMPEAEGIIQELIGSEVVSMPAGHIPHEVVKKNVIKGLVPWLAQNSPGEVFVEAMYQLDEHNVLIPDMGVLFPGRISPGSTGCVQGAPEIAIEVVSSEPAARLEEKIELYLAHGSKSVWVIYPRQRVVRIDDAAGGSKRFHGDQLLADPNVLPGFSIPTSSIFQGL